MSFYQYFKFCNLPSSPDRHILNFPAHYYSYTTIILQAQFKIVVQWVYSEDLI